MRDHVFEDATDMGIDHGVEDLLAVSLRSDKTRGPEQTQVVADQRGRQPHPIGDSANAERRAEADDRNPETVRVAHQPEGLC